VVELEFAGPNAATVRARREGSCGLWVPRTGDRLAYGVGPPREDGQLFRVLDLSQGSDSRAYLARLDSVTWSPDGQRVAWCSPSVPGGFELEVGGRFRALDDCPHAYTDSGQAVYVRGRAIYVEDRLVRVASSRVTAVAFGTDGSVAIVLGPTVAVFAGVDEDAPRARASLAPFRGRPLFAPDNCAVLLRSPHRGSPPRVTVVSLGCRGVARRVVPGNEAAWSPDGMWFAASDHDSIEIYSARDRRPPAATIFEEANQLVWKS
jgi:hypothetical protein